MSTSLADGADWPTSGSGQLAALSRVESSLLQLGSNQVKASRVSMAVCWPMEGKQKGLPTRSAQAGRARPHWLDVAREHSRRLTWAGGSFCLQACKQLVCPDWLPQIGFGAAKSNDRVASALGKVANGARRAASSSLPFD